MIRRGDLHGHPPEIGARPCCVTLSRSEGSVALSHEMLRFTQHDSAAPSQSESVAPLWLSQSLL
jgi:hypothetical protein